MAKIDFQRLRDQVRAVLRAKNPRLTGQEVSLLFDRSFFGSIGCVGSVLRAQAFLKLQEICPAAPGEKPTFTTGQVKSFLSIKNPFDIVFERAWQGAGLRNMPQHELAGLAREIEAAVYPLPHADMRALIDRAFGRSDAAAQAQLVELYPDNGPAMFSASQVRGMLSLKHPFCDLTILKTLRLLKQADARY